MKDPFYGDNPPPGVSMAPEHVKLGIEKAKEYAALQEILDKDEAPLVHDLHQIGWPVDSAWFFVNRRNDDYQEAFPVLLKHLWLPHHFRITEGIVRALTLKSARGIVANQILEWALTRPDLAVAKLSFPIWNCLNVVADKGMAEGIQKLRDDPRMADQADLFDKLIAKLTRKRSRPKPKTTPD